MRSNGLLHAPVTIAIVMLSFFFPTPAAGDTEPFPGSYGFYSQPGYIDVDCDFIVPSCYSVPSATLYFILHGQACTDVVADIFVDSTYIGSTGMLDPCGESPHYDVTSFLADGSARVSLRNPRCSPGNGCCAAIDSTVVTWGGYVYLQGNMTPVSVRENDQIYVSSRLDVYPNPLVGSFSYAISIDHPCRVRLELFDVTGRLLETLLDQALDSGRHLGSLQISRIQDLHLSAGIYFVRLHAGSHGETQRLVLLR